MCFWKRTKHAIKCCVVWTVAFGMVGPWSTVRAEIQRSVTGTDDRPAAIADIKLGIGGSLTGQINTGDGTLRTGCLVTVSQGTELVAEIQTDAVGQFEVTGLQGGNYVVSSDGYSQAVRLWTTDSAPPIAATNLQLVSGGRLTRGQCCATDDGCTKSSCTGVGRGRRPLMPWIIAGGIAAAIAIPLALDDNDGS